MLQVSMHIGLPSFLRGPVSRHGWLTATLLIWVAGATAQSDCNTAIELCNDLYEEENASLNTGLVYEFTGTCNSSLEQSSVWYTFTVQNDGFINFTLDPNNDNDDYDWGLFEITEGGCEGLGTTSPEVSCNSWGTFGINGATGISSALGGSGSSNGPGDLNGPPFNGDLNVTSGQTFALVIMNWSNSLDGYSIDFGASTATLFDDAPPILTGAEMACDNGSIILQFSEPIIMSSVSETDFVATGPGGSITITSAAPGTPGATADDQVVLVLSDPISTYGTYTITITDASGFVEDACANTGEGSITVEVAEPIAVEWQVNKACNGYNGSFILESVTGGIPPYVSVFNGQVMTGDTADGLIDGTYTATVTDDAGCTQSITVVIPNHILAVSIGPQDTLTCLRPVLTLQGLLVEPQQTVTYIWTVAGAEGNIISGANSASPMVNEPGLYSVVVTQVETGCTDSTQVEVMADDELQSDISSLVFPNVFTPNDDSSNETWKPYLASDPSLDVLPLFSTYEMVIYNRWGSVVFESTQGSRAWRPSNDESEGTYFYHIRYASDCGAGTEGVREGTIHLLR